MKVYTNLAAINTNRAYNRNASGMSSTLQRLSSGLRVNSAKDDAAGLAISERFTSQIRGSSQGMRNAADAVSMLQTAEGGLEEISGMLQRMRELSVQAANTAINGSAERRKLQNEVSELTAEITRIAKDANFNGVSILNDGAQYSAAAGGDQAAVVQAMARSWLRESESMIEDYFGLSITGGSLTIDLDWAGDGAYGTLARVQVDAVKDTDLTMQVDMADFVNITVPGDGGQISVGGQDVALDRIIAHEMVHAVMANNMDLTGGTTIPSWFIEGAAEFIVGADERILSDAIGGGFGSNYAEQLAANYNLVTDPGGSERYSVGALALQFIHENTGNNIKGVMERMALGDDLYTAIAASGGSNWADTTAFQTDFRAATVAGALVTDAQLTDSDTGAVGGNNAEDGAGVRSTENSTVVPNSNTFEKNPTNFNVIFPIDPEDSVDSGSAKIVSFQIGANEGDTIDIGLASASAKALNIDNVDLLNDPTLAIGYLDFAIEIVAKQRARLGAQMNRVESVIRNSETTVENLSASRSRILDADYAIEMAEFTRSNIIAQAGTAMQAQAQASSNLALNLLSSI